MSFYETLSTLSLFHHAAEFGNHSTRLLVNRIVIHKLNFINRTFSNKILYNGLYILQLHPYPWPNKKHDKKQMELSRLKQERQISEPYLLSCHGKPHNAEWFLQCAKYLIFPAKKKKKKRLSLRLSMETPGFE